MGRKRRTAFALALALILVLCLSGCGGSKKLRVGTGSVAGNYYSYANVLGQAAEKQGISTTLEVRETAGSAANLRLMKEGFLDLAIVQSDVLADAIAGRGVFEKNAYQNVRTVAGLYIEQCQIVVAQDSDLYEVADLDGKRVSIGEEESGVSVVAREILKAAGLSESRMTVSHLSFSDSADALAKGQIDAFFIMAGAPTTAVSELAKTTQVRLLSLDERIISYMLNLYDGYVRAAVPAGTYAGQETDAETIGVKAVLVADERVPAAAVRQLTELLFQSGVEIRYGTAIEGAPTQEFATQELPGAFHDGSAAYYAEKNISVQTAEKTGKKHFLFGGQDE